MNRKENRGRINYTAQWIIYFALCHTRHKTYKDKTPGEQSVVKSVVNKVTDLGPRKERLHGGYRAALCAALLVARSQDALGVQRHHLLKNCILLLNANGCERSVRSLQKQELIYDQPNVRTGKIKTRSL